VDATDVLSSCHAFIIFSVFLIQSSVYHRGTNKIGTFGYILIVSVLSSWLFVFFTTKVFGIIEERSYFNILSSLGYIKTGVTLLSSLP